MNQSVFWWLLVLLLLIGGFTQKLLGQLKRGETVAEKSGTRKPGGLEPAYVVAYEQVNSRTGSTLLIIQLAEKDFNLCGLRFVFSLIKRDYQAESLRVYAYTDSSTLADSVKFRKNEAGAGVIEYESSAAGLAAMKKRLKELGFPTASKGMWAIYRRDARDSPIQESIEYSRTSSTTSGIRVDF